MAKYCSFSGKELKPGFGKMYIKDNGQILYFENRKSEKNMLKLGRDNRKFKWTKASQNLRAAQKKVEKKSN
ncbi:MAG: 50S ribosomal protein L24e [Candidatus Nanoarchaeia archaeon]